MPVDPHIAALLDSVAQSGQKALHEGTVDEARAAFSTFSVATRTPDQVVPVAAVEDLTVPGAESDLRARRYVPEGDGPFPVVAFFHGGGWVIGDLETHDNMARDIARGSRAIVVSVDYRLAPEAPFPAPVEDAIAAGRWIATHTEELGGTHTIGVAGDSAGANLAAVVAHVLRDEGIAVAGQLLIYPATDPLTAYPSHVENARGYNLELDTIRWFFGHYAQGEPAATDPLLAPLHAANLTDVAPAVIATAEFDPLRDDGEAYAQKLEAAGVTVQLTRYDGLVHGFFDFGRWSPGAQAAIDQTTATFGGLLHASPSEDNRDRATTESTR